MNAKEVVLEALFKSLKPETVDVAKINNTSRAMSKALDTYTFKVRTGASKLEAHIAAQDTLRKSGYDSPHHLNILADTIHGHEQARRMNRFAEIGDMMPSMPKRAQKFRETFGQWGRRTPPKDSYEDVADRLKDRDNF